MTKFYRYFISKGFKELYGRNAAFMNTAKASSFIMII